MLGNSRLVIDIAYYYDNARRPKSLKINLMLAGKCYRLLLSHVISTNLGLRNFLDEIDTARNRP